MYAAPAPKEAKYPGPPNPYKSIATQLSLGIGSGYVPTVTCRGDLFTG